MDKEMMDIDPNPEDFEKDASDTSLLSPGKSFFDKLARIGEKRWIVTAAAFVALVLIVMLFTRGGGEAERLEALENQIRRLSEDVHSMGKLTEMEKTLNSLQRDSRIQKDRLNRLETTVGKRFEQITRKIGKNQAAGLSKATAPSNQTRIYHEIQKSETLYSIARKYGLTVEGLTQLNGIKKGEIIQPGQKLRVR